LLAQPALLRRQCQIPKAVGLITLPYIPDIDGAVFKLRLKQQPGRAALFSSLALWRRHCPQRQCRSRDALSRHHSDRGEQV
jgi:hypothetical protein